MKRLLCLMLCLASTSVFSNDSPEALQAAFMNAMRANDADGMAVCYTADATNFAVDSMVGIGPDAVRESWGGFFANFKVLEASLSDTHMEICRYGERADSMGLLTLQNLS